jgi:hypothetical protein
LEDNRFETFMDGIIDAFEVNFDQAFDQWLTTDKDNYSTKDFLMFGRANDGAPSPNFSYDEVARAEIYDTSTGLFDQSFTETVIDYADFQAAKGKEWYRVDGGMQLVTDTMQNHLLSTSWPAESATPVKVTLNTPVVGMSDSGDGIIVTTNDGSQKYDMVFNTTAMGPLQQMDLEGLQLPHPILTGIRALGYDRATKVVIRFSKPWWYLNPDETKIYGGVSSSDLPISNVVYPSWNDGPDAPATLMVSYAWAQDATRIGSLIPDYSVVTPTRDDPIVTLCLENLVKLWSGQPNPPTFQQLYDSYVSHHAWAWTHDRWTGGAFALFGPGQFKNVYPEFKSLFCNDRLAFCGEALSAHHAWISGAYDSAYYKLMMSLQSRGMHAEMERLTASPFGNGPGKHPEELDMDLLKRAVRLGQMAANRVTEEQQPAAARVQVSDDLKSATRVEVSEVELVI